MNRLPIHARPLPRRPFTSQPLSRGWARGRLVSDRSESFRRGGFTLIELLVTIGIILILIGIVFVAIKHVARSATNNATKIDLQNLQSMLAEMETAGPLTTTIQFPITPPFPAAPGYSLTTTLGGVGDVNESTYAAGTGTLNNNRWLSQGAFTTQFVMGRLRSIPKNKEAMQALPGERLMKAQSEGADYGASPATAAKPITTVNGLAHGVPDPPILVDAWNNPIMFVPSGGLAVFATYTAGRTYKQGVVAYNGSNFFRALKTTSAAVTVTTDWEQLPLNYNAIVRAPGGSRPFFASAGPDGDFQSPDDNVYSFEQ